MKITPTLFVAGLAAFAGALPCFGKVEVKVVAKHVEGIPIAKAEALAERLRAVRDKNLAAERAERLDLLKDVQEEAKPLQDRLKKLVAGDADLKARMASYESDLKTFAKLSEKDQLLKGKDLQQKHRPTFEQLFKKAGIDEASQRKSIEKRLMKKASAMKYVKGKPQMKWRDFLSFYLTWVAEKDPTPDVKKEIEIVLAPPFPNTQSENAGGLSRSPVLDTENGHYETNAVAIVAGAVDGLAGLGQFLVIPGDFRRAKVAAALPDTFYSLQAFAALGAAAAYGGSVVDVLSQNEIVCTKAFDHGMAFAMVGWYSAESGTNTYVVECFFDGPPKNEEIVLSFYSTSGAWSGMGDSIATVAVEPRDIKVRLGQ